MLNTVYDKEVGSINSIQGTLAWEWGKSWDDLPKRIRIILNVCQQKNHRLPDEDEIIKSLEKLELI